MKSSRVGRSVLAAALALAVGAFACGNTAADEHQPPEHRDRHHGRRHHPRPPPPPVVMGYGAPTYVQEPPPIVYSPPASFSLNLLLNFR